MQPRNFARRQAFGAGLHQRAKHRESRFVGERGELRNGAKNFHNSNIIEIVK